MDENEHFPRLELKYIKKEKCNELQKYIESTGNIFSFHGELHPTWTF